jgi:hypothetical protein
MVKKGHKKHSSKSSSDCLTSESRRSSKSSRSSSSSDEENIVINVKHRHNGRKHKEIDCYKDKKDCNTTDNKECDTTDNKEKKHKHRRHKKGSKPSQSEKPKRKCHKKSSKSSSSSSDKPKHRRHKKVSKSSCSSSSEKTKHHKKRSHSSSSSSRSCSSKSEKNRYCFNDIYNYYKQKLVCDENLMVYGSNAYINLYSNTTSVLPTYDPVEFDATALNYNIEYSYFGSPTVVRESGIYVIFYSINVDQSSQFSLFINGKYQEYTTAGNNSGAGQALARSMLSLNKNDTVLIRNYISSSNILKSQNNAGGLIVGNNMTYLLFKIAPLSHQPERECIKYESSDSSDSECTESKEKKEWSVSCLSEKKKYLFKKLLDNMLLDPELMLKGFDVRGTFYTTNPQSVNTEVDFVFDNQLNVNKLTFNNLNPTQVTINESGIYKVFFYGTTNTAVQLAFTVNGTPVNYTIQGTNKGAGQVSLRAILQLNANDYLTVRNHTSANGSIVFSAGAGGSLPSISGILTVFKLAPVSKPNVNCCIKPNKYHDRCYKYFLKYLMSDKTLQLKGSPAYLSIGSTNYQLIPVNNAIHWNNELKKQNVQFAQGNTNITIMEDGVYDVFADVITDEPSQLTLFVNGNADLTTISGRDSGGNRCLMRQFVALHKGDSLEIRNYLSNIGSIGTSTTSGGFAISNSVLFMAFKLCNL